MDLHTKLSMGDSDILAQHRMSCRGSQVAGGTWTCSPLATSKEHMRSTRLVDSSDYLQALMGI